MSMSFFFFTSLFRLWINSFSPCEPPSSGPVLFSVYRRVPLPTSLSKSANIGIVASLCETRPFCHFWPHNPLSARCPRRCTQVSHGQHGCQGTARRGGLLLWPCRLAGLPTSPLLPPIPPPRCTLLLQDLILKTKAGGIPPPSLLYKVRFSNQIYPTGNHFLGP